MQIFGAGSSRGQYFGPPELDIAFQFVRPAHAPLFFGLDVFILVIVSGFLLAAQYLASCSISTLFTGDWTEPASR